MCKIEYDTSNEVILSRLNKLEESLKSGNIKVASVQKKLNMKYIKLSKLLKINLLKEKD